MSRNQKQFIEEEIKPIKYRNCLYRMKLGQYDVEVNCTKKKEGRQLAAQKILQLMHPHITTWGSMLRLYCDKMAESYLTNDLQNESDDLKDAKKSEISSDAKKGEDGQQKAKPNKELLDKLKQEMRKIKKPTNNSNLINSIELDTLSTIPPLILENDLRNGNFLMSNITKDIETETTKENDDGKILFSTKDDIDVNFSKKRKMKENSDEDSKNNNNNNNNDNNNNSSTSSSSSSDDEGEDGELPNSSKNNTSNSQSD